MVADESAKRAQQVVDNLRIPSDAESAFAFGVLSRFTVNDQRFERG
jgi:hypothetical protein